MERGMGDCEASQAGAGGALVREAGTKTLKRRLAE